VSTASDGAAASGALLALSRYRALLLDAVRRRKLETAAVVVLGLIGAMAQVGAIGALLSFLHVMSASGRGEAVEWGSMRLEPGLGTVALVSTALGVMLLAATGASYLSARRARAIGRACAEQSVERLIRAVATMQTRPSQAGIENPRTLAVRGSRLMGVSVESAIKLFHPVVQIAVLLGALVYIDVVAVVWLLPALLLPVPVLWVFHRRVRQSARVFYERAASGFGRAVGAAIDTVDQSNAPNPALCEAALRQYRASQDVPDFFKAYDDMALTSDRSVLITSSFRPLVLVYVLMVLGARALDGATGWASMIAFIVVLVQIMGRAEGILATISVLNRLYTQVAAYMDFIEFAVGEQRGEIEAPRSLAFTMDEHHVIATPGRPVLVYSGQPLSRLGTGDLVASLARASNDAVAGMEQIVFVGRRFRPCGGRYADLCGASQGGGDAVVALAVALGCEAEVRGLADVVVDQRVWQEMSDEARAVLVMGSVVRMPAGLVAMDVAVLTSLARDRAEALLGALSHHVLLIVAPDYRSGAVWAEDVVVMEHGIVVGVGPRAWWMESPLRERLSRSGRRVRSEVEDAIASDAELL
jgi:hypothetical protein